jgi:hypothetical protein
LTCLRKRNYRLKAELVLHKPNKRQTAVHTEVTETMVFMNPSEIRLAEDKREKPLPELPAQD